MTARVTKKGVFDVHNFTLRSATVLSLRSRLIRNVLGMGTATLFLSSVASAQNKDSSQPRKPVAEVAGEMIYEDQFPTSVVGEMEQLRQQEYANQKKAVEELINQKLLEIEAQKRGLEVEKLLELEVESKIGDPTVGEVEAFYLAQKDQLNESFDDAKDVLRTELKDARIEIARQAFLKSLREQAQVKILINLPRVNIKFDASRVLGSPSAPVMIVEFSDFSCPFCREERSVLNELLARYKGTVSLAYRDFPLREIHPQAQLAAEAARCANEQGKFWEYHDLLFAAQDKLDQPGLVENARLLNLEQRKFDSCLSSGRYRPQIEQDVQDGIRAGVSGTPGFFINGIFLGGAQPAAAFEKIIDEQLSVHNQEPGRR
jgi:protein-disulfide isomerase